MVVQNRNIPKSTIRSAQSHDEWHKLIQSALHLAEKTKDPRANALREALAKNQAEQYLRRQGIICPADLLREFPIPK